jgi:hypothetical protein
MLTPKKDTSSGSRYQAWTSHTPWAPATYYSLKDISPGSRHLAGASSHTHTPWTVAICYSLKDTSPGSRHQVGASYPLGPNYMLPPKHLTWIKTSAGALYSLQASHRNDWALAICYSLNKDTSPGSRYQRALCTSHPLPPLSPTPSPPGGKEAYSSPLHR